jgi:hypothetical protein
MLAFARYGLRAFATAAAKPAAASTPAEINAAFTKRLAAARQAALDGGGERRVAVQVCVQHKRVWACLPLAISIIYSILFIIFGP